jgi:hypothetical protein
MIPLNDPHTWATLARATGGTGLRLAAAYSLFWIWVIAVCIRLLRNPA